MSTQYATSKDLKNISTRTLTNNAALWLNGLILLGFLAASTAPSPLYGIYRDAWGFSPLTLTVIFSSYALALLAALLTLGALSNYRGRREVILVALVIEAAAMLLFWAADSVSWLVAARILQGIATGMATSVLAAALIDLHPQRGALINAVAPMIGLATGALGTAVLVQWAPAPTHLIYIVLLGSFAVLGVGAFYLPETTTRRSGALSSLKPRFAVPPAARAMMWKIVPLNTAQWALGGFYFSLGPSVAQMVTGYTSVLIGGALIAVLNSSAAIGIGFNRQRDPHNALATASVALAVGISMTLAGMELNAPVLLFLGAAVSGFSFGTTLISSIRSLVPLASPAERAGLMSAFYVLSYLAFSLPVIVLGWFASRYGLTQTTAGYGLVLILMALAASLALKLRVPVSAA